MFFVDFMYFIIKENISKLLEIIPLSILYSKHKHRVK